MDDYREGITSLPQHMREAMRAWIEEGRRPGRFLLAVLCDSLKNSVAHADDANILRLRDFTRFLHNDAPAECHGSKEMVDRWEQLGGLNGIAAGKNTPRTHQHLDF